MTGTLVNAIAIIVGSGIGLVIGNRLTEKMRETVFIGLGLVTLVLGVQNAARTGNIIIPLLSIGSGAVIGELIDIDRAFKNLGTRLQSKVSRKADTNTAPNPEEISQAQNRFVTGFVSSSLVFCIGPLAILGSVQNGIDVGDTRLLVIKSILDLFTSMAFAASLGIGVMFSAIPTLAMEGGFALIGMGLAGLVAADFAGVLNADNPFIREFTGTGGLLLIGLAIILLDLRKPQPRVANFLPALIIAPLLVWAAKLVGINIYPF